MEEEALDENLGALGRALERNRRRAMSLAGSSASEVPGPSRTTVAEISPSTEVKAIISPTKDRKSFVTVKPSHSKEGTYKIGLCVYVSLLPIIYTYIVLQQKPRMTPQQ